MSRILFISKGLFKSTGGAETAAFQILTALLKQKNIEKIIILTNWQKQSNHIDRKKTLNLIKFYKKVRIYYIPLLKPRLPIFTDFWDIYRFRIGIKKLLIDEKINLIHIHTYSTFYIIPSKEWQTPVLYTFHDFPIKWPNNLFNLFPITYIERIWTCVARRYWKIILSPDNLQNLSLFFHCNGSEIKDYLLKKGVNKKNILVLENGYKKPKSPYNYEFDVKQTKLREIFDPKNQKLKILSVGQFNNIKNQYMLIMGYLDFLKKDRDAILFLVGSPTPIVGSFYMRKIWKNLDEKSRENIIWFGYVSNSLLRSLYRFSDLVLLMSYSEASPLVLGECKIENKVLLSTKTGALKDILPTDLTTLYPNSPDSLAFELKKIYYNREILTNYTESVKKIKLKSWDDIGKELFSFYSYIVDNIGLSYSQKKKPD